MNKQIPESVGLKLVDAGFLIDAYAQLIYDVSRLGIGEEMGVDITNNPKIDACLEWIGWYEKFTGRKIIGLEDEK